MSFNQKIALKKFLPIGLIFIILILSVLFIYGKEIKSEFRYFYWDKFKDIHRVKYSPTKVVHFLSDSLRIVGDLFDAEITLESNPPCILLLHGSSQKGRKAALIQILARKFHEKDYTVLAIDLRAYGDSEDPKSYSDENFDFSRDVISAIAFLTNNVHIDTNRIFIVGHSGGAGAAISSMYLENKAKKMVLLGPPRRTRERVLSPNAKDRQYFLERWKKDMGLLYDIILSEDEDAGEPHDIENLVNKTNHIPIFLVDGEKEGKEDLEYLRNVFAKSAPPVDYWTVPKADHYLNTKYINDILFYEGNAVIEFVERVDSWLKKTM